MLDWRCWSAFYPAFADWLRSLLEKFMAADGDCDRDQC
jgi:hypothetical protein